MRIAAYARAKSGGGLVACDMRKRRSGNPVGFTIRPDIADREPTASLRQGKASARRLRDCRKPETSAHSVAGMIARLIELSATPVRLK
jgi:hypothetical protein